MIPPVSSGHLTVPSNRSSTVDQDDDDDYKFDTFWFQDKTNSVYSSPLHNNEHHPQPLYDSENKMRQWEWQEEAYWMSFHHAVMATTVGRNIAANTRLQSSVNGAVSTRMRNRNKHHSRMLASSSPLWPAHENEENDSNHHNAQDDDDDHQQQEEKRLWETNDDSEDDSSMSSWLWLRSALIQAEQDQDEWKAAAAQARQDDEQQSQPSPP